MRVDSIPLRFERKTIQLPFSQQMVDEATGLASSGIRRLLTIDGIRIISSFSIYPVLDDDDGRCEIVIDTGALYSVFPLKTWTSWPEGTIDWFEPSDEKARIVTQVTGITGDISDARFGRVRIILWNLDPEQPQSVIETAPFTILAKFMSTVSSLSRPVFGMAGDAMERWQKLEVDFHADEARLVLLDTH